MSEASEEFWDSYNRRKATPRQDLRQRPVGTRVTTREELFQLLDEHGWSEAGP